MEPLSKNKMLQHFGWLPKKGDIYTHVCPAIAMLITFFSVFSLISRITLMPIVNIAAWLFPSQSRHRTFFQGFEDLLQDCPKDHWVLLFKPLKNVPLTVRPFSGTPNL